MVNWSTTCSIVICFRHGVFSVLGTNGTRQSCITKKGHSTSAWQCTSHPFKCVTGLCEKGLCGCKDRSHGCPALHHRTGPDMHLTRFRCIVRERERKATFNHVL